MKAVSTEVYERIDNALYSHENEKWWTPDSPLYILKTSINPVRVSYAQKKIALDLRKRPSVLKALEVGCGGGILTEEIARMGFQTTGIDPSAHSIEIAKRHAAEANLNISYQVGSGESLPYAAKTFDVVFCCDVLEHVRDLPAVISEISRVLKYGGVFIYDTINRTLTSKIVSIKIFQEWKRWAFMPPNLHVWEMFIRPEEMKAVLQQHHLEWKEHRGTESNVSVLKTLGYLRKRAKGEWGYKELGTHFRLVESNDLSTLYMGYAIKREENSSSAPS